MSTEDLDQPQEDGYELVVPFIVCQSKGGPHEDDAFVAGFQCGQIDQALKTGPAVMAVRIWFPMVRTDLREQLELIAMHRGYPVVEFEQSEEVPEWADVTFKASEHDI